MEVKETLKENCVMQLRFEAPYEEVKPSFEKEYKLIKNTIRLPGFRQGRAPENIVRERALPYIIEEFKKKYFNEIFKNYIIEKKINIYRDAIPKITKFEFSENQPFVAEIEFEIYPQVNLTKDDYKDIKLSKLDYSVSDDEVNDIIEKMLFEKQLIKIEEIDMPISKGYLVTANVSGKDAEGNEIPMLTKKNYFFEFKDIEDVASEKGFSEKFIEEIAGKKKGDKIQFEYEFSKDFEYSDLKGKKVFAEAEILKVEKKNLPEITDDIAKQLGYDNVEQLYSKIKSRLEAEKKNKLDQKQITNFFEILIQKIKIDLPKSMVDAVNLDEQKRFEKQFANQFKMYNIEMKRLYNIFNTTAEEWLEGNKTKVENDIKQYLLASKIIENENLKPDQDEIEKELELLAQEYGKEKKELKRELIKNEQFPDFLNSLSHRKLEKLILENYVEK